MSCACPGRLEVSRGIVEANQVTLERHQRSLVDLTSSNSGQLNYSNIYHTKQSVVGGEVGSRIIRDGVLLSHDDRESKRKSN